MHDDANNAVDHAPDGALVGVPGSGFYLGSSDIEGFQAQMFLLESDARADDWLAHLTTTDGATLTGFSSTSEALAYHYAAPLRGFPARIAVAETDDPFPHPSYALASADSDALDLIGLALGYATLYAVTDANNRDVGGAQAAQVFFDGDPFPADDQLAD